MPQPKGQWMLSNCHFQYFVNDMTRTVWLAMILRGLSSKMIRLQKFAISYHFRIAR